MSRETLDWLNSNVLVGFTDKRGHAWHYRQGADNHYPGAIPVADVASRLFFWVPVSEFSECPCGCGEVDQIVSRSDNKHRMGRFTDGYKPHDYKEWLLENVSTILGDTLAIGSAGLLKKGAIAWVSVEVPDNITTPEGVVFRPNLLGTTSFDGSISTTFKRIVTIVVCDNTREIGLRENGQQIKYKHTKNSAIKIADAREALAMVHTIAEDFEAEVRELVQQEVSKSQWEDFLNAYVPLPEEKGKSRTMAENKRDKLAGLYMTDPRCAPWTGTAFGVVQSVNTYNLHESIVRNVSRPERNMINLAQADSGKDDREAYRKLQLVLSA